MTEKKKSSDHSVGYKKPPRHTQFKPGQSGNPKGRPRKSASLSDVLQKELRARVPIVARGQRQLVSMLEAIVKQILTKAAGGDPRAAAVMFKELRFHQPDQGDNLRALVQEFRAANARNMAADKDESKIDEAGGHQGDVES